MARLRRQGKTDHLGRNRLLVGHKLERIRQLHGEGLSLRAIGKQLHVSPMTVMRAGAGACDVDITMSEIAAEMGVSSAFVFRVLKARQRLPAPSFGD